ncbi:helix-turn-helix transcriptional regulator [Streptomyces kaniharaensis]|uniref:Helix-turn-helix transcriptional regulator n=1 Tax=Streptomyces kaniharaensis TaxID=212423 RepID=A0A6N7KLL2_9ACTN|nr:winged helix-turn-helix domain-containing protein [Streptomyces kaniharaensis]MQS11338.1 helix-turn-helix transcriptional regulator [Streptomyces kaniharaensis]
MITLTIDSTGLARSRFAVSPLHEAVNTLMSSGLTSRTGPYAWVSRTRRVLRRERLELLSALALDKAGGYLPDFLSPHPTGPSPEVAEQLAAVRATPPDRVLGELTTVRRGRPEAGLMGRELPDVVERTLQRGPRYFAQRAADELSCYWDLAIAPYWPDARAVLDAEVDLRGRFLARHGTGALINSLAPELSWADGRIRLESRITVALPARMVLLMPTLVTRSIHVILDPIDGVHRAPTLMYPAAHRPVARLEPSPALAQLLGPTRADLLAALTGPATTATLAGRHYLNAGTVSYHLGVLHRSGLVSRVRSGREVLYRRTPRGEELVAAQ